MRHKRNNKTLLSEEENPTYFASISEDMEQSHFGHYSETGPTTNAMFDFKRQNYMIFQSEAIQTKGLNEDDVSSAIDRFTDSAQLRDLLKRRSGQSFSNFFMTALYKGFMYKNENLSLISKAVNLQHYFKQDSKVQAVLVCLPFLAATHAQGSQPKYYIYKSGDEDLTKISESEQILLSEVITNFDIKRSLLMGVSVSEANQVDQGAEGPKMTKAVAKITKAIVDTKNKGLEKSSKLIEELLTNLFNEMKEELYNEIVQKYKDKLEQSQPKEKRDSDKLQTLEGLQSFICDTTFSPVVSGSQYFTFQNEWTNLKIEMPDNIDEHKKILKKWGENKITNGLLFLYNPEKQKWRVYKYKDQEILFTELEADSVFVQELNNLSSPADFNYDDFRNILEREDIFGETHQTRIVKQNEVVIRNNVKTLADLFPFKNTQILLKGIAKKIEPTEKMFALAKRFSDLLLKENSSKYTSKLRGQLLKHNLILLIIEAFSSLGDSFPGELAELGEQIDEESLRLYAASAYVKEFCSASIEGLLSEKKIDRHFLDDSNEILDALAMGDFRKHKKDGILMLHSVELMDLGSLYNSLQHGDIVEASYQAKKVQAWADAVAIIARDLLFKKEGGSCICKTTSDLLVEIANANPESFAKIKSLLGLSHIKSGMTLYADGAAYILKWFVREFASFQARLYGESQDVKTVIDQHLKTLTLDRLHQHEESVVDISSTINYELDLLREGLTVVQTDFWVENKLDNNEEASAVSNFTNSLTAVIQENKQVTGVNKFLLVEDDRTKVVDDAYEKTEKFIHDNEVDDGLLAMFIEFLKNLFAKIKAKRENKPAKISESKSSLFAKSRLRDSFNLAKARKKGLDVINDRPQVRPARGA